MSLGLGARVSIETLRPMLGTWRPEGVGPNGPFRTLRDGLSSEDLTAKPLEAPDGPGTLL